jgi:hypothetical protein
MSLTGVGVSTSVGKSAECLVGKSSGDGKVGVPAINQVVWYQCQSISI